MKILFVNFIKFWGGGESWTYQVMDELRKRNHTVVLLSNEESKLKEKAQQNGFQTRSLAVRKLTFLNFGLISKVKTILTEINPDAIILNSTLELKTIGLAIEAFGCSKVIYTRGIPSPMDLNSFKRHLFSNVVTDVIVNSNYVKASISNITPYLKREPQVLYHGIQTDTTVKSSGNTKNIAIVGRLSHEKGVDIALQVMQEVLKSEPQAQLWIIGDGKEKEKLVQFASKLGIQDSVQFFGFVTDVATLLAQCSMLILPSRWEGFGLVLLEAMKLQMPCIAFDHTAASEIIVHNETGFLIPELDVTGMTEKVLYLLSNPEVGQKMGLEGNKLLKRKFTIKKSIDQYEQLISRK